MWSSNIRIWDILQYTRKVFDRWMDRLTAFLTPGARKTVDWSNKLFCISVYRDSFCIQLFIPDKKTSTSWKTVTALATQFACMSTLQFTLLFVTHTCELTCQMVYSRLCLTDLQDIVFAGYDKEILNFPIFN